ncbi:FkbM family methyltransferase [Catellatospora paridis]|uniref:FkbM family methyltransferase n=1 Tax=Catellatospora paridis TaxID=1617086 RepID=UPI001E629605|nr:FkbM family methyltransferase [Catellatospora paridis]
MTIQPYSQPVPFHSQWGEDRWLADHRIVPAAGWFVDVGAGDGTTGSNTLYFEGIGWHGVCIDPDPRNAAGLARRTCGIETVAISAEAGLQVFSMYRPKPSWSGLGRRGAGYDVVTMTCTPLETLLAGYAIDLIDLLSIDVEGNELDVWQSFDPDRHLPSIVIIEYDDKLHERSTAAIHQQLGREAYGLVHRTPANLIFQNRHRPWQRRS